MFSYSVCLHFPIIIVISVIKSRNPNPTQPLRNFPYLVVALHRHLINLFQVPMETSTAGEKENPPFGVINNIVYLLDIYVVIVNFKFIENSHIGLCVNVSFEAVKFLRSEETKDTKYKDVRY